MQEFELYNSNLSLCSFPTQLPWNREPACREARKTSIAEARDILAVFLVSPFSILFDCESIYLYLLGVFDRAIPLRKYVETNVLFYNYLRFYLSSTIRNFALSISRRLFC